MFKQIVVVLAIAVAFATGVPHIGRSGVPHKGRIFGGQDATSGQFPYVVAVNNPTQGCDGVIVAPSWILTSALCGTWITPEALVYVGSHLNEDTGTSYKVIKAINHAEYDEWTLHNDIALLRIDGTLEYNDLVQAIELGGPPAANSTCTVVGWGATETEIYPQNLKYVDVTAISLETCQSMSAHAIDDYYLGEEQVCTVAAAGMGSCWGDAGGPLICDGTLAGVVSYTVGFECGAELPDIYSSVAAYADWIQEHIQA